MNSPADVKEPLTDIRLLELGQLIAGPFCGQLMADMGAKQALHHKLTKSGHWGQQKR